MLIFFFISIQSLKLEKKLYKNSYAKTDKINNFGICVIKVGIYQFLNNPCTIGIEIEL